MSGGVDSSVAAYLLKERGYEVIGVTLKFWKCDNLTQKQKQRCCSKEDVYDAKLVAAKLGIKHFVLEIEKEFENRVVKPFCEEYLKGFTPNPCVVCNKEIKFGLVYKRVSSIFGTDTVATGHYSRKVSCGGRDFIVSAKDKSKDQSYFLSMIGREVLSNVVFPVGELEKSEVRRIASKLGLRVATKKDSFEICFVNDKSYRSFLEIKVGVIISPGPVVDVQTGRIVGEHIGCANYTIGQRSGLKLKGINVRKYVVGIDISRNVIYVGDENDLYESELIAKDIVVYDDDFDRELYGKIRYKSELSPCSVKLEDNILRVRFFTPQRAITPGQYVVVYDNRERVICAGKIFSSGKEYEKKFE